MAVVNESAIDRSRVVVHSRHLKHFLLMVIVLYFILVQSSSLKWWSEIGLRRKNFLGYFGPRPPDNFRTRDDGMLLDKIMSDS